MVTYKTIVVPTDGSENANKLKKKWKKQVKKF